MTGRELAARIRNEYGTQTAGEIAAIYGVAVRAERWHPVTAGEFDRVKMEIVVNESANMQCERIVAHELGHYFLFSESISVSDQEQFCDDFAESLLAG